MAGCTVFPSQGPYPQSVTGQEPDGTNAVPYVLAELTPAVVAVSQNSKIRSLGGVFRDNGRAAPALNIGVGDIVAVTIFEAATGGLFIPADAGSRPGNYITLPPQEVNRAGFISVPYAGDVPAAGRSTAEVQRMVEDRLRNRAIEPQILVTVQESRASLVAVTGDVNQPGRFPISRASDRLLDAITRAGGSKWPAFETYISLLRGGRTGTVYFNRLLTDPTNNIFLQPGDTIILKREVRAFMALGASGQNGQINFDQEELTLAEAVGRAGGVIDSRGDPAQTFLYRLEPRRLVEQMGLDIKGFAGELIPVVYRVNLRQPEGFFLASKFPMHNRDVLFVSNAAANEISKVLGLIQAATNTVTDSDAARISIKGGRR